MRNCRQHGFTLLELTVTITIMGMLAAVAIPAFTKYIRKAETSEVRVNLGTIAALERAWEVDHRSYLACPAVPAEVPKKKTKWKGSMEWTQLGFHPDGAVQYQYEVELTDKGFIARARGDLDGDDNVSLFEIRSEHLGLDRRDELE
jgi:prepilin-type N-terminal cleavage/methylation domain-containing protein